jgi:hypothetical protein
MFGTPINSLGHTYAVTKSQMPWVDAQVHARSTGGYLVAVNNLQENGFLVNAVYGPLNNSFWIGAYDIIVEDVFQWTDGSPTSPGATTPGNGGFANWASGEPNGVDEDCVEFRDGNWNDLPCAETLYATAEWPGFGTNVITMVDYHNGHRYAVTEREMTWIEARNLAESLGGRLVVVNDAAENQFITDTFLVQLGVPSFWLGATDFNMEGTFGWIDGSPFAYTNWLFGEPNDAGGDEDCAATIGAENGLAVWNDLSCSMTRRAIIEWNSLMDQG